jgi:hypothetical protein
MYVFVVTSHARQMVPGHLAGHIQYIFTALHTVCRTICTAALVVELY